MAVAKFQVTGFLEIIFFSENGLGS